MSTPEDSIDAMRAKTIERVQAQHGPGIAYLVDRLAMAMALLEVFMEHGPWDPTTKLCKHCGVDAFEDHRDDCEWMIASAFVADMEARAL